MCTCLIYKKATPIYRSNVVPASEYKSAPLLLVKIKDGIKWIKIMYILVKEFTMPVVSKPQYLHPVFASYFATKRTFMKNLNTRLIKALPKMNFFFQNQFTFYFASFLDVQT